jgi:hypothetical protein
MKKRFQWHLLMPLLLCLTGIPFMVWRLNSETVRAMENQEVKPYVFAELPHGRIYKTVHEGCELYIVENDMTGTAGQNAYEHFYSISSGRGCK